jgi:hypothetical protein
MPTETTTYTVDTSGCSRALFAIGVITLGVVLAMLGLTCGVLWALDWAAR